MNKAEIEKEIERLLFGSGNNHYINERRELLKARLSQRIDDEKEFKEIIIELADNEGLIHKNRLLSSLDNGGMK